MSEVRTQEATAGIETEMVLAGIRFCAGGCGALMLKGDPAMCHDCHKLNQAYAARFTYWQEVNQAQVDDANWDAEIELARIEGLAVLDSSQRFMRGVKYGLIFGLAIWALAWGSAYALRAAATFFSGVAR